VDRLLRRAVPTNRRLIRSNLTIEQRTARSTPPRFAAERKASKKILEKRQKRGKFVPRAIEGLTSSQIAIAFL
jgi:hypothetical protein